MYAPVCSRFLSYDVKVDKASAAYCHTIMEWTAMMQWTEEAKAEPAELEELDAEF